MPLYEYICPKTKKRAEHRFDLIMPVEAQGTPQLCPEHNCECQAVDFSTTSWAWGMNEIHWSAGTSGNPNGMNHAKKPGKK